MRVECEELTNKLHDAPLPQQSGTRLLSEPLIDSKAVEVCFKDVLTVLGKGPQNTLGPECAGTMIEASEHSVDS
ncbi:uncharacterized protein ATNIH1004_011454 [Aspergillus tanneri]|nr:uncharacterized protein ATNIH1004_011454 [Aspergillus tanneri]KAA8642509.1 hypothetical protein ATNIH1004_011454 [Aspergillus tanneri]